MLRLEGDAAAPKVGTAAGTDEIAVQEVTAVDLEPGLGGLDLERTAASMLHEPRGEHEAGCPAPIEHEVVVVSAGKPELLVVGVDPRADGRCSSEVERRAGNRGDLTRRQQLRRRPGCTARR